MTFLSPQISDRITALAPQIAQAGGPEDPAHIGDILSAIAASARYQPHKYWKGLIAPKAGQETMTELSDLLTEIRAVYETPAIVTTSAEKLADLRQLMAEQGWDAVWVPLSDAYQGEYIPLADRRLQWLTGFSGSAGAAVILQDQAAFFTDGRYQIQAPLEVDPNLYQHYNLAQKTPLAWVKESLPAGANIIYDPWLHTHQHVQMLEKGGKAVDLTFVPVTPHPIDSLWHTQPPAPVSAARPHPHKVTGKSSGEKRHQIAAQLKAAGLDGLCLTAPDSVAWILNIRGEDIDASPYCLSRAILYADGTLDWFVNPAKIASGLSDVLGADIMIAPEMDLEMVLQRLVQDGQKIQADPGHLPAYLSQKLAEQQGQFHFAADPVSLAKACKNEAEITGSQTAHRRDGVAVVAFLTELEQDIADGAALTEMDVVDRLWQARQQQDHIRDISFDTIAGVGPNGAITHYRVDEKSNRPLTPGQFLLVDSGGQYLDGTTDITRCFAIGTLSEPDQKEISQRYTQVLKGHLALRHAVFPVGTSGSQLDCLARQYLWQAGLDYDHGTGHGVGSYLSVHEGPQRISKLANKIALQPGMILSNEPGFYKKDHFGIRIENLILVRPADFEGFLCFEDLTCVPYDRRLIRLDALTETEIEQIDQYHRWVAGILSEHLSEKEQIWLQKMTAPLICPIS